MSNTDINGKIVQLLCIADMNQSVVITVGVELFNTAQIVMENTQIMNRKLPLSFMLLSIPMCMVTLLLNMSVLMILSKKENTIVNQLMKLDCIVSIVYSSLGTFQQSPCYRGLSVAVYCYPHMMLSFASVVSNKLLPVAIVVFR